MGACLKITAGFFLLVQVLHLASPQTAATSSGTIDISWLRELKKTIAVSPNAAAEVDAKEQIEFYQGNDEAASESSNDGIPSGHMAESTEEEENVASADKSTNETSDDLTAVITTKTPTNVTNKEPESDATISPTNATIDLSSSSQRNRKEDNEEVSNSTMTPQNSTTDLRAQNSTSLPENSNHTEVETTTPAPERKATTQESTETPDKDTGLTNATESTETTAVTTTTTPEVNKTSTTSPSTTVLPPETTEMTTTAAATIAPEKTKKTNKTGAASGSSSERGLATDTKSKRNGAWGAVLGTAVAVALVGLVAYIILKKHQKGFSHRKLVEEYPSEPVHRLENGEPLDLNFGVGGSAYYNPGLQGDNIQMTNIPGRR